MPNGVKSLAQNTFRNHDGEGLQALNDPFEEAIDDALSSMAADLRAAINNVEIVVEDEPPAPRAAMPSTKRAVAALSITPPGGATDSIRRAIPTCSPTAV